MTLTPSDGDRILKYSSLSASIITSRLSGTKQKLTYTVTVIIDRPVLYSKIQVKLYIEIVTWVHTEKTISQKATVNLSKKKKQIREE